MNRDSGFFLFCNFIYLFWALRCCAGFSLAVVSGSYSQVVVPGLLIAVASLVLVAEDGLWGLRALVVVIPRL